MRRGTILDRMPTKGHGRGGPAMRIRESVVYGGRDQDDPSQDVPLHPTIPYYGHPNAPPTGVEKFHPDQLVLGDRGRIRLIEDFRVDAIVRDVYR